MNPAEHERQAGLACGSALVHVMTHPQEGFQYLLNPSHLRKMGSSHMAGFPRGATLKGRNAAVSVCDEFLLSFLQCVRGDIGKEAKGVMMKATSSAVHRGAAGVCLSLC